MTYMFPQKVLFRHCDPAGIVFYPRYFEMINDCIEAFFDQVVDVSFEQMHLKNAVPTAQIDCKFVAPSRQGDQLVLSLKVLKLGRSSLSLSIAANCENEDRFHCNSTIVYVNETGRPIPWTDQMRDILSANLQEV
jgi:4-hydroxybenzoyl-CoA thioesterase